MRKNIQIDYFVTVQHLKKMNEIYKKTDISLIPTIYSEGTSLSCLEAMATENIVISTRIGGLCDLIIDNYNGYLIEPTEEDLYNKLKYVLDNYDKQEIIKKKSKRKC
ncbi:MAG: glycosyltransferase [Clostridium sp.]|nr:MAG: glycosyltransferase [Clostridium sp.]